MRKNRNKKVRAKISRRGLKAGKKVKVAPKKIVKKRKARGIKIVVKKRPVRKPQAEVVTAAPQSYRSEETKYYSRPSAYMPPRQWEREELPSRYGEDKIVLMARDPYWVHAYWEVTDAKKADVEREAKTGWNELRKVLRVYDVTGVNFDGTNAHRFFDIDLNAEAVSWYINVGVPDRSWCVDFGVITRDGRFILIVRSNVVTTPRDSISDVIDEEWMSIEDEFLKLYGLWGGFAGASPGKAQIRKIMRERLQKELASGGLSSFVRPLKYRGFWLVVNTELIVYGATEPDADVSIQGRPIKLNRDGTFTLRFALPDGEQVIPVKAVSADKAEERVITPIVKKYTK